MRVLHLTPLAFGADGIVGGGERYPVELARAMSARVPTTLLAFGARPETHRIGNLTLVTVPVQHHWDANPMNPLSLRLIPHIARADVVHLHQWESVLANAGVVLARGLGKKVFATDHGGSGLNYARRFRLHRLLTGFLPVSEFGASFYPAMARTTVIHGGVNHRRYVPPAAGSPRHGVVYVGRLLPHKGIDVLLDALPAELPLRLIGRAYDPEYLQRLHALAAGKTVSFDHDASDDDVVAAYRGARAGVLPSLLAPAGAAAAPKAELLGLALVEAMACGTPVVATRTGGMPEVVQDGVTGFVVPPGDRVALVDALRRLVEMPLAEWTTMSVAARERVERHFTWAGVADRCLRAYGLREPLDTAGSARPGADVPAGAAA